MFPFAGCPCVSWSTVLWMKFATLKNNAAGSWVWQDVRMKVALDNEIWSHNWNNFGCQTATSWLHWETGFFSSSLNTRPCHMTINPQIEGLAGLMESDVSPSPSYYFSRGSQWFWRTSPYPERLGRRYIKRASYFSKYMCMIDITFIYRDVLFIFYHKIHIICVHI